MFVPRIRRKGGTKKNQKLDWLFGGHLLTHGTAVSLVRPEFTVTTLFGQSLPVGTLSTLVSIGLRREVVGVPFCVEYLWSFDFVLNLFDFRSRCSTDSKLKNFRRE